ncbi:hypothetical protein [Asticcacaulis sp.]|uniref:hypothetical protein n=1 Tax=Asticcacaulis sp. TaxID=1872648 RepID=UPI0026335678|nr:hypothetical protein [Asticcacaulis sp.]
MDHSAQAAIEAAAKVAEPPPGEGQKQKIWIIMFLPEIIMIQIFGRLYICVWRGHAVAKASCRKVDTTFRHEASKKKFRAE